MIFSRYRKKSQAEPDPGAKLINRIMMLGLLVFMIFAVLSEKKTLEKTKFIWQADINNLISGFTEEKQIIEGNEVILKLDKVALEKLKTVTPDENGNIEIFKLKLTEVAVKENPTPKQPANKTP